MDNNGQIGEYIRVKLSDYAKRQGISYRTAWRWFKAGILNAEQMPTGTIIVRDDSSTRVRELTVIYARVSAAENKSNLDSQAERARQYCAACARLYGQRRSKRKTEKIIAELTDGQSAQKKK